MRLRGGISYEARIGIIWNVPTHERFWRPLQHHFQTGQGNLRHSDSAADAIDEGRFQTIGSVQTFVAVLENLEGFRRGAEKNSRPPLKDQSKNPAVLWGRILVSSCSTVT